MPTGLFIFFVEEKTHFLSKKLMSSVYLKLYRFYWMFSKQEI